MSVTPVRADTVLDGTGGPAIRGGAAVLIHNQTIQAVGPRADVIAPADAEIVELPETSIVPGICGRASQPTCWSSLAVLSATCLG